MRMDISGGRYSIRSLCICMVYYVFKFQIAASAGSGLTVTGSTSLYSLLPSQWTTDQPVDTDFINCDHLELIDGRYLANYNNPFKYDLSDILRCPPNETVERCRITLRGKRHIIWEAFSLCYSEMNHALKWNRKSTYVQITVSSSEDYYKFNSWQSLSHSDPFREVCAPPGEDLQVVYNPVSLLETNDFCLPEFDRTSLEGAVMINPVLSATINLISKEQCYKGLGYDYRGVRSETGTVVSSYQSEWTTEDLHFCKGRIRTEADTKRVCFKFSHFTTYLGGPSLEIRSSLKKRIFDFNNPIKKGRDVCIPVQGEEVVYTQVFPGEDPLRKFHHDFLAHFRTTSDDGDEDILPFSYWWIVVPLGILCLFIPSCIVCYKKIKEKNARNASSHPQGQRAPSPTSVSAGNEAGTEMALNVQSAASPDSQNLPPSYEELIPKGKKDCAESV